MKSSDLGPVLLRCRKGLRTHPAESPVAPAHTLRTCCPNTQESASKATLTHEPYHQTVCAVCAPLENCPCSTVPGWGAAKLHPNSPRAHALCLLLCNVGAMLVLSPHNYALRFRREK